MSAPKKIARIEYGLLSPKEIRKMSVRKIIWPDTYDDDGFPYPQGLMDLNLGVIDPGLRCKTCDQKAADCPGHFGHIELAKPVIHVGYVNLIYTLLSSTCRKCGKILPNTCAEDHIRRFQQELRHQSKRDRDSKNKLLKNIFYWTCSKCGRLLLKNNLDELEELSNALDDIDAKKATKGTYDVLRRFNLFSGARCRHCGEYQSKRKFRSPNVFIETEVEEDRPIEKMVSQNVVLERLRDLDEDDYETLGVCKEDIEESFERLQSLPKTRSIDSFSTSERYCSFCGEPQQYIFVEQPSTFFERPNEKRARNQQNLTAIDIESRLKRISNEDLRLLGFDPDNFRPEWTILSVLPVPPVTMRPSIIDDAGKRLEDDLTHKLVDIVLSNQRLRESTEGGASHYIIEELWQLLQYHVNTYLDNHLEGTPPAEHYRTHKPLKTLSDRLIGDCGRIRELLTGKYQNFCATSVLSPNPELDLDEIGVPEIFAEILTVPVRINRYNINYVSSLIMNEGNAEGKLHQHYIVYVIRPDGRKIKITEANKAKISTMISYGWVVERHLCDGDLIFASRSPVFSKTSLLAYRAKLTKSKTLQLNPTVCRSIRPSNTLLDDGYLKIYVPRSDEARAEASELMKIQNNIISSRCGGPAVGLDGDLLTGVFLLTHNTSWFTKQDFLYLLGFLDIQNMPPPTGEQAGVQLWDNKFIFSQILPHTLNMTFRSSLCRGCENCRREQCSFDAYVSISNSTLQTGTIDKTAVGISEGEIITRIFHEFGPEVTKKFIEDCTKLSSRFLMIDGFSLDFDDWDLTEKTLVNSKKLNRTPKNSAYLGSINSMKESMWISLSIEPKPDKQDPEIYQARQNKTHPYLHHHQERDSKYCFVQKNLRDGLSPSDFFREANRGRQEMIQEWLKISHAIKLKQKITNATQNLKVYPDGSVRTRNGFIVQFLYGEDGADPAKTTFGNPVDVRRIVESVVAHKSAQKSELHISPAQISENTQSSTSETATAAPRVHHKASRSTQAQLTITENEHSLSIDSGQTSRYVESRSSINPSEAERSSVTVQLKLSTSEVSPPSEEKLPVITRQHCKAEK